MDSWTSQENSIKQHFTTTEIEKSLLQHKGVDVGPHTWFFKDYSNLGPRGQGVGVNTALQLIENLLFYSWTWNTSQYYFIIIN